MRGPASVLPRGQRHLLADDRARLIEREHEVRDGGSAGRVRNPRSGEEVENRTTVSIDPSD
jgi:hypothetical protein